VSELKETARKIRIAALKCHFSSKTSHIGSGFSCVDLLVALYGGWLKVSPATISSPDRDRFILSKGHAAAVYYATLAEFGFIPNSWLETYCAGGDDSFLGGHVQYGIPGVEFSTGSLGHGLPAGVGMALGAKRAAKTYKIVVLMSDGEMDSGSNWEAALFAAAHKLDNLMVIVDRNGQQGMGRTEDILPLGNLAAKWEAFGWAASIADGHDFVSIINALNSGTSRLEGPCVIIADTVKGKGVSFMEDSLVWHYRSPDEKEYLMALRELEAS
jgi:transketolase